VAIDNARLYEELRRNKERLAKEVAFAQTIQRALLPTELPKRIKGIDVAMRLEPARELGRRLLRLPRPGAQHPDAGGGRRLRQGRARGASTAPSRRTGAVAHVPPPLHQGAHEPAAILESMNTILHERQLESYYCTALLRPLRLQAPDRDRGEQRAAVPHHASAEGCGQVHSPGVPLGSLPGIVLRRGDGQLAAGDVFVFYSTAYPRR